MATTFLTARSLLAPYVDNGVATSDTNRIDARIDEAQRRLIDQYNFISRREESDRTALVWQQGGSTGEPTTGDLILDNLDATKNMILALWREENNALDQAAALEKRAYEYIERNILNDVERERKAAFQAIATASNQNTLGGLTGRIGLETVAQYKLTESRIKSYVNQAYQQAVDHFNFISRREDNRQAAITFAALVNNSDAFSPLLPSEVVKLLALGLIATDNGADGSGLKEQALGLIERNITTAVETARRDTAGEAGHLHNELPEGEKILTSRLTTYLAQAATEALAQWSFFARRENYSSGTAPAPFSFEVRKKLVESYIATTSGAAQVATALKQEAFSLIERDLMTQVEAARRAVAGEEGRLHNELPEGVKIPTARLTTYLSQAATEAGAHWDFVARREDYSSGTEPSPFPFEVRKKLVESYLAALDANPQVATALKTEALGIIERDVQAQVEPVRRAASGEEGRLHNELPEGVKIPTARLTTYLAQAATEAGAHWDFVARREDYSSGTKPSPFSFEIRKKLVESYLATASARPDVSVSLKTEALGIIERDIQAGVEATRRAVSGEEGRLHNELLDGVKVPTARLTAYLSQANTEAGAQWDFLARRENYSSGAKPDPFSFEIRKRLVEAYLASAKGAPDVVTALKQDAFFLIERDIMAQVETSRSTALGFEGQLHNELPEGVKIPTARLTAYLAQAATEAGAHWDFLARREDYSSGTKPTTFSFEIRKKLVESYLATASARPDVATALKTEALSVIERDIQTAVEATRRAATGETGQLHNELPDGEKIATARFTTLLAQAATEAGAHWDFLARREDYSSGTKPTTFSFEIRKKLVESYLATASARPDVATALKTEALSVIERDIQTAVEATRRAATGETGQLHNELPDGVKIPTARLTAYLAQAVIEIATQQAFIQRREDYSGTAPSATYEQKKLLVESYLATSKAIPEAAAALKQNAFALVERDVVTAIEAARRATRQTLLNSDSLTFGYHWGRIGLETQDGLKFSDSAVKRALNSAEEQLMLSGKWLGTVEEYTLTVTESGEVYVPREIETLLFVSFDGNPRPIHDRFNEWLRGGTGYRTDDTWRSGLVDRGEGVDPADDKIKHKYFFSLPDQEIPPVIRVLAKRRFVPHTDDSEPLYLRNFQAVAEMAKGILSGGSGPEMDVRMKNAKEMLATQVNQQFFRGQPNIVRRRILAMR